MATAGIIGHRTSRNRRGRAPGELHRPTPIGVADATKSGNVIAIEFDGPVILRGVPQYTTDLPGVTPVSAVLIGTNVLELTFSGSVDTATALNIPYEDPGIRNNSGGYVGPSSVPV